MPDLHLSDVKKRGVKVKMESKQVRKKTETTELEMVIFSGPWYVIPEITAAVVVGRLWKQIMS